MSILHWSAKDLPVESNASINGVPTQPKQETNKQINNTTTTTAQSKTNVQLKVSPNISFKVKEVHVQIANS